METTSTNTIKVKSAYQSARANQSTLTGKSRTDVTKAYSTTDMKWIDINLNSIATTLIDEAINNAVDNYYRSSKNERDRYSVDISFKDGKFIFHNTGVIPAMVPLSEGNKSNLSYEDQKKYKYNFELAFGVLNSSSNYDQTSTTIGIHGWGAFLLKVFSKYLKVTVRNRDTKYTFMYEGEHKYTRHEEENEDGYEGVEVSFKPDYKYLNISRHDMGYRQGVSTYLTTLCTDLFNNYSFEVTLSTEDVKHSFSSIDLDPNRIKEIKTDINGFEKNNIKLYIPKLREQGIPLLETIKKTNDLADSIFVNGKRFKGADVINNIYKNLLITFKRFYPDCTSSILRNNITVIFSGEVKKFEVDGQRKTYLSKPSGAFFKKRLINVKTKEQFDKQFENWPLIAFLNQQKNKEEIDVSTYDFDNTLKGDTDELIIVHLTSDIFPKKFKHKDSSVVSYIKSVNTTDKFKKNTEEWKKHKFLNSISFIPNIKKVVMYVDKYSIRDINYIKSVEAYTIVKNTKIKFKGIESLLDFDSLYEMSFLENENVPDSLLISLSTNDYINEDTIRNTDTSFLKLMNYDPYNMFKPCGGGLFKITDNLKEFFIEDGIPLLPLELVLGENTFDLRDMYKYMKSLASLSKNVVPINYYPGYKGNILIKIDDAGYKITKLIPRVRNSKQQIKNGKFLYSKVIVEHIPPTLNHFSYLKKLKKMKNEGVIASYSLEFNKQGIESIELKNYISGKEVSYTSLGLYTTFEESTSLRTRLENHKELLVSSGINWKSYKSILKQYVNDSQFGETTDKITIRNENPTNLSEVSLGEIESVHDDMMDETITLLLKL